MDLLYQKVIICQVFSVYCYISTTFCICLFRNYVNRIAAFPVGLRRFATLIVSFCKHLLTQSRVFWYSPAPCLRYVTAPLRTHHADKLGFIAPLHRRGSALASPFGRGAPVRTLGRRGPSQSKIKDF